MRPWVEGTHGTHGTIGACVQAWCGAGTGPHGAAQILDPSLAMESLEVRGGGELDRGTARTGQDKASVYGMGNRLDRT